MRVGSFLVGLLLVGHGWAQLPSYEIKVLQARASIFNGAFNLPAGAAFNSVNAVVNDAGQIIFQVGVLPGTDAKGLWFGAEGLGDIVYQTPSGATIFGYDLNSAGMAVFEQGFSPQDGLYLYDSKTDTTSFATSQPLGADGWTSPGINATGALGFRARFTNGRALASFDGGVLIHAVEAGLDPGSTISFLFTPSFNANREIAAKIRLGTAGQVGEERPDQIGFFTSGGAFNLIVEDSDSDGGSPYAGFDNSVALTDGRWVAFIARLVAGGRGVFISDGNETLTIAVEGKGDISEIEFFGPAANEGGLVAFRAKDGAGLGAIWVGDGTNLTRVIAEHDLVSTDLGMGRIDRADENVVFGGGVCINEAGQVAFTANLTAPDNNQDEWGSGVFLAGEPACVATFAQYLEAWAGPPVEPCTSDQNGNGTIDVAELIAVLALT